MCSRMVVQISVSFFFLFMNMQFRQGICTAIAFIIIFVIILIFIKINHLISNIVDF